MKNEIGKRLTMLRESKQKTRREISDLTGIPYTTYCHYEDGSMELKSTALIKLSVFYGISADWILGHDTETTKNLPPDTKWEALEGMLEKLSDNDLKEVWSFVKFLHWRKMNEKA